MSWKKFFLGDKMPDKDDPKYQKQYEREVSTGRKFAEKIHLDVPFRGAQRFANRFPMLFLCIVFGFVGICLCLNIYRMTTAYRARPSRHVTATERQEHRLQQMKDSVIINTITPNNNEN